VTLPGDRAFTDRMIPPSISARMNHGHPQLYSRSRPRSQARSPLLLFRSFLRAAEFARKLAWLPVAVVAADLLDVGRMKNQGQVHGRAKESVLRLIRGLLSSLLRPLVEKSYDDNARNARESSSGEKTYNSARSSRWSMNVSASRRQTKRLASN